MYSVRRHFTNREIAYLAHVKLEKFGGFILLLLHRVPKYVCFHPKAGLHGIGADITRSFLTPHCKMRSLAAQRLSHLICDNLADMM